MDRGRDRVLRCGEVPACPSRPGVDTRVAPSAHGPSLCTRYSHSTYFPDTFITSTSYVRSSFFGPWSYDLFSSLCDLTRSGSRGSDTSPS